MKLKLFLISISALLALVAYQTYHQYVQNNRTISWDQTKNLIMSGQVSYLFQSHSLLVKIELLNGQKFTTVEPFIDEIYKVINECGTKCSTILIATE